MAEQQGKVIRQRLISKRNKQIEALEKVQSGSGGARLNPRTQEAEDMYLCEFKASLVYRVNSRMTRSIQRNPVLKNQKGKKKRKDPRMRNRFWRHV